MRLGLFALVYLSLVAASTGWCQTPAEAIRAMYQAQRDRDRYTLAVTVMVREGEQPPIRSKIVSHRLHDRMEYSFNELLVLTTPQASVVVDSRARSMALSQASRLEPSNGDHVLAAVDSALADTDSIRADASARGILRYTVFRARSPISRVQLGLDSTTHLLRSVHYVSVTGQTSRVVELEYDWQPLGIPPEMLELDHFVVEGDSGFHPAQAFQGYAFRVLGNELR